MRLAKHCNCDFNKTDECVWSIEFDSTADKMKVVSRICFIGYSTTIPYGRRNLDKRLFQDNLLSLYVCRDFVSGCAVYSVFLNFSNSFDSIYCGRFSTQPGASVTGMMVRQLFLTWLERGQEVITQYNYK